MSPAPPRPTRRQLLLSTAAAGSVGAAAGAAAVLGFRTGEVADGGVVAGEPEVQTVSYAGLHQAGVDTTPPAALVFAAVDLTFAGRAPLRDLLRRWTDAIARLTEMRPTDGDSGESTDAAPAALTITLGVGATLFDQRFALGDALPPGLRPLPAFAGDRIDPRISGGDLMVQVCAEDSSVALHAARQLIRLGGDRVRTRWLQRFGPSAASRRLRTPRNLFGQRDGTNNPAPGTASFDATVWLPDDAEPAWLRRGTYAVVRKIRMDLESWDATALPDQERVLGRRRDSGAPLSGGDERTAPDFAARAADGRPAIDLRSHLRLAQPAFNNGATMFRRGYSYHDGIDPATGDLDAGLFFLAFVADVRAQFVPVQRRLADQDLLTRFTTPVSSSEFAVLPGVAPGEYLGHTLLD